WKRASSRVSSRILRQFSSRVASLNCPNSSSHLRLIHRSVSRPSLSMKLVFSQSTTKSMICFLSISSSTCLRTASQSAPDRSPVTLSTQTLLYSSHLIGMASRCIRRQSADGMLSLNQPLGLLVVIAKQFAKPGLADLQEVIGQTWIELRSG